MSTDRDLIEKAAKAAGIELQWKLGMGQCTMPPAHPFYLRGGLDVTWNPLTDDGDALRLAVKLRLFRDTDLMVELQSIYLYGGDHTARTRHEIVRAAASMAPQEKAE